jgi:hypothetical protein
MQVCATIATNRMAGEFLATVAERDDSSSTVHAHARGEAAQGLVVANPNKMQSLQPDLRVEQCLFTLRHGTISQPNRAISGL